MEEASGDNAIIVCPSAAMEITDSDIEAQSDLIAGSSVYMTQLEQPVEVAKRGLEIGCENGVTTILNPAPAAPLGDDIYILCDFVTPNETEMSEITGMPVETIDQAKVVGDALLAKGVGAALITLGEQ